MSDDIVVAHTSLSGCGCPACSGADISLDPQAGGVSETKPIWSPDQIAAHLNRTGLSWKPGAGNAVQSDGDQRVINFGFHESQATLAANGYRWLDPVTGRNTVWAEYNNFAPFSEAQRTAAREALQYWDDVIAVSLAESHIDQADIAFGNLASAPTTQAFAILPSNDIYFNPDYTPEQNAANNAQVLDLAGDIWISASQASNSQLDEGGYGMHTLAHEIGHAIGISHPGRYNAAPGVSITYANNAEYAQDTRTYSVMSYFNGTAAQGARHFDFRTSSTAYSATPLIHDIAAAQRIYGADMTTRTGDTTYGFNSNAARDAFDFVKTPAPVMAIWDAGGVDTLDASGFVTTQLIDLTPGSLSSIGGVTYDTAPSFEQVNANRAAAGLPPVSRTNYDANMAALNANPVVGRLLDNVAIAYGVTIENARGGSGSDTIIGNAANNQLFGNAGSDVLTGKEG
ncbi:MAG: M10 family metallopeptidase C-terminal domain-containing protein, partial [Proteobacteria bacterium]|nr:M10 family metallopeptidase C-terminal domain-containing protein [Pseudomonadota bacterium]